MEFGLTDEQRQIRDEVRRFAENEIEPVAGEYDRDEAYPHEVVDTAADRRHADRSGFSTSVTMTSQSGCSAPFRHAQPPSTATSPS